MTKKKWKKEAIKWFQEYMKMRDKYNYDLGKVHAIWENFDDDLKNMLRKCENDE